MKKALVALALAALATSAQALIAGGSHDMTAAGTYDGTDGTLSTCWYCHAPHNVNTTIPGTPLWNRTAPAGVLVPYTSTTINDTTITIGANSKTCLSCHDGVTNMGEMYVGTDKLAIGALPALQYANLGVALSDDHPVGVTFTPGVNQLQTLAIATAAGFTFYAEAGGVTVECASCHEPHGTSDGTSGGFGFLRATSAAVACTGCHNK